MPTAGLKTIISLSFVLAVGFLLVILSCALYQSYFPLLVVATYVVAPLPNWICSRCANPDDFVESSGAAVLDLGRFLTGFLVVMGMGTLPPTPPLGLCNGHTANGCSSSYCSRSLRPHPRRGHGHVDSGRFVDLRNHHQLQLVLPRGARILSGPAMASAYFFF